MDITAETNTLTAGEFIDLFRSVSWSAPCEEQAAAALQNSLVVFTIRIGGKAAAMARIVGDGAMTFFIKDVVVSPEFQGKGLGKRLMAAVEDYITRQLAPGWTAWAELMSAAGKEEFYRKCGFTDRSGGVLGAGMMKKIRR